MTQHHAAGHYRTEFTCVDTDFKSVAGSAVNQDGMVLCSTSLREDVERFLVLHMIITENYHVQFVLSDTGHHMTSTYICML